MSDTSDTIAAVATPRGAGGIAVVRVSGPEAIAIVAGMIGRAALPERRLVRGVARDRAGVRLDEVLAVAMPGPRSFTGEDVAEVHGHGGTVNAGRLLREVLERGARLAEPGEFTRRAFERGKLDLSEAEGLLGVIEAASERAWKVAQAQLAGALSERIASLRSRVTALLAEIEACVDFPDEGLEFLESADVARTARELGDECAALAGSFRLGRALRDGLEVALVGPVNAGKSSLFNALVGKERALVAPEPGTTRDYVEARVEWEGIAITLIDTAGERSDAGALEQRGIDLGRDRAASADLRVWVTDSGVEAASASSVAAPSAATSVASPSAATAVATPSAATSVASPSAATAAGTPSSSATLIVRSKADLGGDTPPGAVATSAHTGLGIDELRARILAVAGVDGGDDTVVVTTERQRGLLERAAAGLHATAAALPAQPPEVAAVDAREALTALAALTGETVGETVLDVLFARFCIGK